MKTERREDALLLLDSGELRGWRRRRLERSLARDADSRMRLADLRRLRTEWKRMEGGVPPLPEDSWQRIKQAAGDHLTPEAPRPRRRIRRRAQRIEPGGWPWFLPLPAAAGMILAAGLLTGLLVIRQVGPPDPVVDPDTQIAQALEAIDTSILELLDQVAAQDHPPELSLDALALQLLIMEDS